MKQVSFFLSVLFVCCLADGVHAGEEPRLTAAYMCEQVSDAGPENRAVIFSASDGKAFCFCHFNSVPEKTFIYHVWYHGDRQVTRRKLSIEPPAWRTYSSIQLRETDKGPWRVEILGADGKQFDILRFSVTD